MKLAIILILCMLGCGQDPPPDGQFRLIRSENLGGNNFVRVLHDDRHAVTCWSFGGGLSCLPDSVLK